jgi:putative restriction endonuclease
MAIDLLSKYVGLLGNLHRNHHAKKGYAPHKPILLLAVLDEVESGNIDNNLIVVTPELVASFRAYWRVLVPQGVWIERMVYPFRYLVQEGWWT